MTLEEQLHRMEQDLQLRGMSASTQFNYLRAVRKYSEYFKKLPDQITESELRDYFIYLKNVKKYSRSTSTQAICGIKFFYTRTCKRDWETLRTMKLQIQKTLPEVIPVYIKFQL